MVLICPVAPWPPKCNRHASPYVPSKHYACGWLFARCHRRNDVTSTDPLKQVNHFHQQQNAPAPTTLRKLRLAKRLMSFMSIIYIPPFLASLEWVGHPYLCSAFLTFLALLVQANRASKVYSSKPICVPQVHLRCRLKDSD